MHVTLIAAQSLDGFITRHEEPGSAFTSPEDKQHFRNALRKFDCQVMGANTYRTGRDAAKVARAPGRLQLVMTRNPAAFATEVIPDRLEFTPAPPAELLAALTARGRTRCALLGGSQVHSAFLAAGLVNELWLTIEARLFGRGTPLLAQKTDTALQLVSHDLLSANTLLVKYRVGAG